MGIVHPIRCKCTHYISNRENGLVYINNSSFTGTGESFLQNYGVDVVDGEEACKSGCVISFIFVTSGIYGL